MSDESSTIDVVIVGGGPAGLSAAIWLGRYLHSVTVVDSGDPRNWETRGIHGYLGLPHCIPSELRGIGRDEARHYGVTLMDDEVTTVTRSGEDEFTVKLLAGGTLRARRMLLAIGIKDEWPDIPGLDRCYGVTAHHCPDCDGYEARDRGTVVVATGRKAMGMVLALLTWTSEIVVCTNGRDAELDDEQVARLESLGVLVLTDRVTGMRVNGEGEVHELQLAGGAHLACERLFFAIGQFPADDLGVQLGCDRDEDGLIVVDDTNRTSVEHVYAAGDIVPGAHLAMVAAASGSVAALAIHKSLLPSEHRL